MSPHLAFGLGTVTGAVLVLVAEFLFLVAIGRVRAEDEDV